LVLQLLAVEAVPRPGNRLDTLLLNGLGAVDAGYIRSRVEARKRLFDEQEDLAVAFGKRGRDLLGVGGRRADGHVLRRRVDRSLGNLAVLRKIPKELVAPCNEAIPPFFACLL